MFTSACVWYMSTGKLFRMWKPLENFIPSNFFFGHKSDKKKVWTIKIVSESSNQCESKKNDSSITWASSDIVRDF